VVLHQQIDYLGSVAQCGVQTVQRRPGVFIACIRQAWIVRQQHANPVGSIAADCVVDPGSVDQQVDAGALPEVGRPSQSACVPDRRARRSIELSADYRRGVPYRFASTESQAAAE
jgi:hypothetical protein